MPPVRSEINVSVSASGKSEKCKKPLTSPLKARPKPMDCTPLDSASLENVSTPEIRLANVDQMVAPRPCAVDPVMHPKEFRTKECSACAETFTPNNGRQLYCHNCSPKMKQHSKRVHVEPLTENEHKRCIVEREVEIDNNGYIQTISTLSASVARLSATIQEQQNMITNMSKTIEHLQKDLMTSKRQSPIILPQAQPTTFLEAAARDVQPRRAVSSKKNTVSITPAIHQLHPKLDVQIPAKKLSFKEICEIQHKIEKSLPADKKNFVVSKFRAAKKGGMVLNFDSQTDCDKALKNINDQSFILGLQASEIKLRPRLLAKNIPVIFTKEEILAAASQKLEVLSSSMEDEKPGLRIVTVLKNSNRPDIQSVVFEATPKAHSFFLTEKKITIGMCRYDITEHVHMLQCSHCMKYGHHSTECKALTPNCGVCAKKHLTQSCPHFNSTERPRHVLERRCVDCDNSQQHRNVAHTHAAIDKKFCPVSQSHELSRRQLISHVC